MTLRVVFACGLAGLFYVAGAAAAQPAPGAARDNDSLCRNAGWDGDHYRACEVREYTLVAGSVTVDAGGNGGVHVQGADRSDIRVRAVLRAQGRSEEEAKALAAGIDVQAGGGHVSATAPPARDGGGWSVTYHIEVPRQTHLDLQARNGGIQVTGVSGNVRFSTTNGGVRLIDVNGDVRGATRNGGVNVTLSGARWEGAGLDVETANGGIRLTIPENYSAELTARTVNGGLRSDLPLTIEGELSPGRGISTRLGSGGAPLHVRTRNGGVRIERR